MNQKYHSWEEHRYSTIDRTIRIIGAIAGSGAIASFAIWKTEWWASWIWTCLTALVALANAVAAAAPPADRARTHADLRQRHTSLRYAWEALYERIERVTDDLGLAAAHQEFERLKAERGRIEASEPAAKRKLLARAQNEVLEEIGRPAIAQLRDPT